MFAHLDSGQRRGLLFFIPPLPLSLALPTTSIFYGTRSRPKARGKSLASLCPTAEEDGREMEGRHRPERQKCPQLRAVLFSFLQKPGKVATLHHCSLSKASNYLYICLRSNLLMEARRAGLAQLLMTPNRLALLLGALPSGLALEELPAPQRELDLFHVMRLTQKERSCSQHLLTLSQL